MRKSLIERGKWKHSVPRQEEGEPQAKHGRWYEQTNAGADLGGRQSHTPTPAPAADSPDSLPALENSPTDEGTWRTTGLAYWHGFVLIHQC